jgi:uncharacterized SAM-binding protein YcdF (DUF218 family)
MLSVRFFLLILFLCVFILAVAVVIKPALLEALVVAEQTTTSADALVVMAGSRRERLSTTARLYHDGYAPRVLLTNDGTLGPWSSKYQRNLYHVESARDYLLDQGVPEEAIELLNFTKSGSYYDALNTRDYVLANGAVRCLLVVTSDYHTRRTLWTFNKVFAGADVKIAVFPIPKDPAYKGRRLRVMTAELVKLVYYLVRYGLFPVG